MSSPVTIPNPTTMLSYQKAVDANLVDKSYQKVMAKKVEANGDRIGWSADSEFSRASSEVIRGIGSKYAEALRDMSVFNFAITRGGAGFAGLAPIIGKEGVTNLRNLQAALKACMLVSDEPVAMKQVTAERFAELFASDFNGHDVGSVDGEGMGLLLFSIHSSTGEAKARAIDVFASAAAFELLRGALATVERGMSPDDMAYQLQDVYHGILGQFCGDDAEAIGQKIESLMNEYAGYVPESVQSALGLDPSADARRRL